MTTKTEQSRPCPFCGSDAKESDQAKAIYCSACFAGTSTYMDVRYAAEHWNSRPIEDQLRTQLQAANERIERLEKVREACLYLSNEAGGLVRSNKEAIKEADGITNYNCITLRIRLATEALAELEKETT